MPRPHDSEKRLAHIMSMLADSVLEAPEDEILAEVRQVGIDPNQLAEEIRRCLQRTSKEYQQRKLKEAQRAYELSVKTIRQAGHDLPADPLERRKLLGALLTLRPEMRPVVLTAQYRDFRDLPDADVESFLKQLKQLGLLELPPPDKSK